MNNTPREQLIDMAYKAGIVSKLKKAKREENYSKSPNFCSFCGEPLPYNKRTNKFCSHSCSASYNNQQRISNPDLRKEIENKVCKHCGRPITKHSSETYANAAKRDFCCRQCWLDYSQENYIRRWKNGEESGNCGESLSDRVRKYMLDKVGNKCPRCGWCEPSPYDGRVHLEVHHKDGNYLNSSEDNLEVLCPNCHTLTETYGSRNLGKGRYMRNIKAIERKHKLNKLSREVDK